MRAQDEQKIVKLYSEKFYSQSKLKILNKKLLNANKMATKNG